MKPIPANSHAFGIRTIITVIATLSIALPQLAANAPARGNGEPAEATVNGGRAEVFAANERLGRGINLGNMFEAPSEEAWGNPFRPEYLDTIADLGFSHVRIPVRWETSARSLVEPPHTIAPDFLERIGGVVDRALELELAVIINMHHHQAMLADPEGQRPRFLSQWEQIAEHFAEYPGELLFEIFNEPHGAFTPDLWNAYLKEALAVIRRTNPDRFVLVGTPEWGGLNALERLEPPDDDRIILTVHYYLPFPFTHQGASWVSDTEVRETVGVEWRGTEPERAEVRRDLDRVNAFAQRHGLPVHMGEFGAYSRADLDSRVRWTTFVTRSFEEYGFSWAYWEFSAGFGIYNPGTEEFNQALVDALLTYPIPPVAAEGD